ncbi:hypothetical protein COLO4_23249 [Corchorus olitorius]|uniref:Uncharacterized protein n=1 Tax=Corchorus olitorius TaxID=93759 RepID=A0A1R3IHL5_9ROSI|nr:hypothetical protein COLO4_23249 [Corchorus olitorius]
MAAASSRLMIKDQLIGMDISRFDDVQLTV